MALVVFLRGVNVGGHRTFRPALLARELQHLDAVSIGAAGTFVVRRPTTQAQLRAEIARRLPFDAEIVIRQGRDVLDLASKDPYSGERIGRDMVRFVSVLSGNPRLPVSLPVRLPATGRWLVKILGAENRFVFGVYRRHMRVITCLGALDRLFGVPVTTRNWNTITAVAHVLGEGASAARRAQRSI